MIDITGKRVILSGLVSSKTDLDNHLVFIRNKVAKWGGIVVGEMFQRRGVSRSKRPGGSKKLDKPLSPGTYIGPGKVKELKELAENKKCDIILFINELTPHQKENLENETGVLVEVLANV